jgi:hypothetical protein
MLLDKLTNINNFIEIIKLENSISKSTQTL